MLIASLYGYFKFSQYVQVSTPSPQNSSIEILPNTNNQKGFEEIYSTTLNAEISEYKQNINNSIDDKETKTVDLLEILGTVTNRQGESIAGVFIYSKGEFPPTYTDANGQYHLVFKKSGVNNLLLIFSLSGYEKQKNRVTINEFEKSPLLKWDVTLEESLDTQTKTSVGGKVRNRSGEGIADQRVHLITLGDFSKSEVRYIEVAVTDKNGNFTINDISINRHYQLVVLAGNGYERIEVDDLLVTDDMPDTDIVLEDIKLANISGQVVDREGVPIPHLELIAKNISNSNANDGHIQTVVTDDSGVFRLNNFPEGKASFSIRSPAHFEISGINFSVMDSQIHILTVDIGNFFLSGLVSDSNGDIIEGAIITLQSTYSNNGMHSVSVRSDTTDNTGAFAFEKFGFDLHYIKIFVKGYLPQTIIYEPHLSDADINIVLERP